jgi:long-chain fatty acid transport protein
MALRRWEGVLRAGTALAFLLVASAQANAGGFAIHEQSVYGQGTSFAGIAAGGALSSMFWNPATMTQFPGIVSETDLSGVFPFASHATSPSSTFAAFGGAPNSLRSDIVPAGYTSYQLYPDFWLGLSINAPFGLSVSFPDAWAGRNYAGDSSLRTYNAAPSIAYRFSDWLSVGAGVQIQYGKAQFERGLPGVPPFTPPLFGLGTQLHLQGTGWGFGATAGVTLTPTPWTTIGLGWRSAINQKIQGEITDNIGLPVATHTTLGSANTTLKLPDIVSLGIRQRLDPRWTLLGTAEWTNWSRIGTSTVDQLNGAPATAFGSVIAQPFQYRDGWFFSGGAEYNWDERLTLRGGLAYEITPISDQVRTPVVPDNDRVWASIGATWRVSKFMHFDLAYSHVWVKEAPINISAASGNPSFNGVVNYIGTVNGHGDVLSLALVVRLDYLEPTARRPFLTYQ